MSERETRELTTPNGHKVVIKTYLTARELRAVEAVYATGASISPDRPVTVEGSVMYKAQDELLKQALVSVNGVSENCSEKLLDLRKSDFDFVLGEVDKISREVADVKKGQ